jgi:hypothetical protein
MAEQAARRGSSATAILEGEFTIDHDRVVALGLLHSAPFAAGEVVNDLHRPDGKLVEVVYDNIGLSSLDECAAVLEASTHRGMCA